MRKKILLRAFSAELADDLAASRFFFGLSDDQQRQVLEFVARSRDESETLARTAVALRRLREGRIDFM